MGVAKNFKLRRATLQKEVKVRARAHLPSVAGAIAHIIRSGQTAVVCSIGPRALKNAFLAVALASKFLSSDGINSSCTLQADTVLTEKGPAQVFRFYVSRSASKKS